jgi:hypothetical protein
MEPGARVRCIGFERIDHALRFTRLSLLIDVMDIALELFGL